jgi:thioredoxin 1
MTLIPRPFVFSVVVALVAGAFALRAWYAPEAVAAPAAEPARAVPRAHVIELGSKSCKPCKAMMPVLAELRAGYGDTLEVTFIDVWAEPDQGKAYGVSTIPTQILFAPDGRELERHVGFWPAADILARFEAHGFPQRRAEARP